jgi:hypothetical protein
VGTSRKELAQFMTLKEAKKEETVFQGGGLVRSIGGRKNLEEHRKGAMWAYDERVLGEGKFVESVLKNEIVQSRNTRIPDEQKWVLFEEIAENLCEQYEVKPAELAGVSRRRKVSEMRSLPAYAANSELVLSAAEIGRALNVSGQAILKGIEKAEETWESLDWVTEGMLV